MKNMILEFLLGLLFLHLHWGVLAGGTVLANRKFHLPSELYRKLLHFSAVFSIIPIVLPMSSWLPAVLVCIVFMLEAYVGSRKTKLEKNLGMKQRRAGEQQQSMLLLYMTYIILIVVSWAVFGQKWAVILAVVAWGVGDAFAALIGKSFGRHKLQGKYIEGTKSVEGTLAMFVSSFAATFFMYRYHTSLGNIGLVVLVTFWVALFACLAELFSKRGKDTFFCPVSAMTALIILTLAAGGI